MTVGKMNKQKPVKREVDNRKFVAYDHYREMWINFNGCSLDQLEKEILDYLRQESKFDSSEIEIFQETSLTVNTKRVVEIV